MARKVLATLLRPSGGKSVDLQMYRNPSRLGDTWVLVLGDMAVEHHIPDYAVRTGLVAGTLPDFISRTAEMMVDAWVRHWATKLGPVLRVEQGWVVFGEAMVRPSAHVRVVLADREEFEGRAEVAEQIRSMRT